MIVRRETMLISKQSVTLSIFLSSLKILKKSRRILSTFNGWDAPFYVYAEKIIAEK